MISLYCYRQRTIAVFANRKFVRYRHNKNRTVFYFVSSQGETIKSYRCTVQCTLHCFKCIEKEHYRFYIRKIISMYAKYIQSLNTIKARNEEGRVSKLLLVPSVQEVTHFVQ